MARLDLMRQPGGVLVAVTLSRRNLLALLHKLALPSSLRTLAADDCYVEGEDAYPELLLVLRAEDDDEHYARRDFPPGPMSPDTEAFITGSEG